MLLTPSSLASATVSRAESQNTSNKTVSSPPTSNDDFEDDTVGSMHDEIAIIGMSCRVPGGNNSPTELWDFLMKKGDASGSMPAFRWKPYHSRNPRNVKVLSTTTSTGYFLERLEDFDAAFFAISPREAEQMDPQQRITLEVAWLALENAGIPPSSLAGSNTAVFMGVNSDDYAKLILEDLENIGAHMGVGTAYCGIPSRISYVLDLMGPSLAVDAACASSLVAVHQACQAIKAGEADLAIAGGVNALIGPGLTRVLDEAGAIAADGKCRSFDDSANGYGRGEGAGVVVLKRLQKAIADGDHVLGLVKGSAVCSDGKTAGIMAPNAAAQKLVAAQALKSANVPASSISYIEAHATSTPLGDPTETDALAQIYGAGARKPGDGPLPIGSIKANIGHLEAGAGVMGLIKAVMVLQNQIVPPQANLNVLNTKIDWDNNMLVACKESMALQPSHTPLRAAIASYGYSGVVSHAIIERAANDSLPGPLFLEDGNHNHSDPCIVLLSGPQANRIPAAAERLASWLLAHRNTTSLRDVANTLASRREHHRFRSAIVATNIDEAMSSLQKLARGMEDSTISHGRVTAEVQKGFVWVFSGHGSHWDDMGKGLYETRSEFRNVVHQLEPIFLEEMGFSPTEALKTGDFGTTDRIQAITFLMHLGIAEVLRSETGDPSAIVGHSLGEAAAAVAAGAITAEEGARLVCRRSCLYRQVQGHGTMALISLPASQVITKLGPSDTVDIAIDSSPHSCVISGAKESIVPLCDKWQQEGIEVRWVKSDVAFHSRTLAALAGPLRSALKNCINPNIPTIPLYSTSSQDPRTNMLRDAEYWVANMVRPVLLRSTIEEIAKDGHRAFVEVSSHPIILHSISDTLSDAQADGFVTISTMVRNKPALSQIYGSIAKLHCFGADIDYIKKPRQKWLSEVPGTTWSHTPFWRQVAKVPFAEVSGHDPLTNTLLGKRCPVVGTDYVLFQTQLDENNKPFPGNHPLHGSEIVPAAVLLNTFLHAAAGRSLEDVSLKVPVVVSPARDVQVQLAAHNMQIVSRLASTDAANSNSAWLINTIAGMSDAVRGLETTSLDVDKLQSVMTSRLPNDFSIAYLAKVGVPEMGFPWKVTKHLEGDGTMLAHVDANPDNGLGCNDNWTSMMDAATSIASTIFYQEPRLRMPTSVKRVTKNPEANNPKSGYIFCRKTAEEHATNVLICDDAGNILLEMEGMAFADIEGTTSSKASPVGLVHQLAWVPASYSEEPVRITHVAFFTGSERSDVKLFQKQLSSKGITSSILQSIQQISELGLDAAIIHVPSCQLALETIMDDVSQASLDLIKIVQNLANTSSRLKVFSIVESDETLSLRNVSLHGLARILHSEHPENFGGLIEIEDSVFPTSVLKYIQDEPVIRIHDGIPRISRLRPFAKLKTAKPVTTSAIRFRAGGTYLITGGQGALGLEVAKWMVEQGARRLLLVSRSKLPHRSTWDQFPSNPRIQTIIELERRGASIYLLSADISTSHGASDLVKAIESLSLPAIKGVVHAAGVLEDQMVKDITVNAFETVLRPKIVGAMNLHNMFTVGTLDFFTMFSSCGQLLGFPGQASYATANAFLDALAAQRRQQGDNCTSIMWTSWRGLGMAASTDYINAELNARGITDITTEEAFMAWAQIATSSSDHAVVLRTLQLEVNEPVPHPIINDIVVRNAASLHIMAEGTTNAHGSEARPAAGPELEAWLSKTISECVAKTLDADPSTIDPLVALAEMGMDSVMTLQLRSKLQKALKIKTAPTLIWKCPTVNHLVKHFTAEFSR